MQIKKEIKFEFTHEERDAFDKLYGIFSDICNEFDCKECPLNPLNDCEDINKASETCIYTRLKESIDKLDI